MNKFYNLTCAWCFIANSTLLNIEWPDGNSQYYGTIVNTTRFKLSGSYPNSRYFSYELYSLDNWEPFWDIHDKQIVAETNPYLNPSIAYNSSIKYNLDVDLNSHEYNDVLYLLIYRIYLGVNETGGVHLPYIYTFRDGDWSEIVQCEQDTRPVIDIQNTPPQYKLYKSNEDNNFYPPQNKSNLFINYDARYMVSFYNNSAETFGYAKIKVKIPDYSKTIQETARGAYQVRYLSLSTIDLSSPRQTTQTINDELLYNHSIDGTVTVYLFCRSLGNATLQLYPPSNDNYTCDNQTRYFGVLYRQLLPKFPNEIPNTPEASQDELSKMMGDYYPEITWITRPTYN